MKAAVLRLFCRKSFTYFRCSCLRSFCSSFRPIRTDERTFLNSSSEEAFDYVKNCILVCNEFVTENEEECLLRELETDLRRQRYEDSHWDDAIHKYRETEKAHWSADNRRVIERIQQFSFPSNVKKLNYVHILDLAEEGVIKPHIDSVRFCGSIIAGLSLSSSSVMRLINEKNKQITVDVLLKRRSLYIMKDRVRYEFTHEILPNKLSFFNGEHVRKGRRISIICRCEPEH